MASAVEWPTQVLAAATVKLETPIGAFLWKPVVDPPCLVGRVFMDLTGRFQDGRLIRTPQIVGLTQEKGWTIARTFSGSNYLLVEGDSNFCFSSGKLLVALPELNSTFH
ncbi:hypothetical protein [Pseudomonas syringae]|uniref:hypothetical protein n=1 Tax=Pseudomonas syringae TaxID=317 RepID=UPI000D84687F|nr:hypothetical protein [Pseudomonas syringae]PYD29617.1 hypothetical protein DND67_15575 [Pseudomonas syringae pv. pisi]